MKTAIYHLTLSILFFCINAVGQVQITSASLGSVDTNWTNLGDIIIHETQANDIYSSNFMGGKLALLAPSGFEFNGIGNPTYSSKPMAIYDIFDLFAGGDPIQSMYGNRVIIFEFEFNGGSPKLGDTIILSGLQVRAIPQATPPIGGHITRVATSNDENINGILTGTTSFGILTPMPLSIENHGNIKQKDVRTFPNPFSEEITIEAVDFEFRNAALTLYDLHGKKVLHKEHIRGKEIALTRKGLPNGIYQYRIVDRNNILITGSVIAE